MPVLSLCGKLTALGIAVTAVVLLASSACRHPARPAHIRCRCRDGDPGADRDPNIGSWRCVRHISWGVLPLVAGLFVLVEALENTGVTNDLAALLGHLARTIGDRGGLGIGRGCSRWAAT